MTVQELINQLSKFPPDKEIMVWDWSSADHFRLMGVDLFSDEEDVDDPDNILAIKIETEVL